MKTAHVERKLQPIVSCRFGGVMLLALFGVPLAMHLLVGILQ